MILQTSPSSKVTLEAIIYKAELLDMFLFVDKNRIPHGALLVEYMLQIAAYTVMSDLRTLSTSTQL